MTAYKAMENKAFHRGAYIAYRVTSNGTRYTTNGSIMVCGELDTKPVKGQLDLRNQEMRPIPFAMEAAMTSSSYRISPTDFHELEDGNVRIGEVKFDGDYIDYLLTKYEGYNYSLSSRVLVVQGDTPSECVAMLAPIKEKGEDDE